MTPPSLPLEIYYKVLEQVITNKDLSALSLCCRTFRDEAQRQLFRHPFESYPTSAQQGEFFDAIIASPIRLAPMVKSYTIRRLADFRPSNELARNAATAALPLMYNLTTLKIHDINMLDMTILPDCSLHLDMLSFGLGNFRPRIELFFIDFLRKQTSLRHLRMHGRTTETINTQLLRDDHAWCPNLVSFGGDQRLINMFLAEHRPIRHLYWYNSPHAAISKLQSPHLSSVEYLSCTIVTDPPFPHAARRMTSLVLLDVSFMHVVNRELLRKLKFLESTPQLRCLILAGVLSEDIVREYMLPAPENARTAFQRCPALEHIDISRSLSADYSDRDVFDRYTQDASGEMNRRVLRACEVYAWKVVD